MNEIKFSKEYPKLHGQTGGILLAVLFIDKEKFPLSQELLDYDTKAVDGSYYPLPKNDYLQLVFLGDKLIPFCTIRRRTPEKEKYYLSKINQEFKLIRAVGLKERVGEQK